MRKKKTTSTDIAKAAGVSQSAVSMILNKKYNVSFSKETVEKVEQIAKELGYQPPKRKIRKESRREKLLVVFCSNLTNPYYVMLLQGIETRAKEAGFGLFICNTQRSLKMEERYLRMMPELFAAWYYLHMQSESLLHGDDRGAGKANPYRCCQQSK